MQLRNKNIALGLVIVAFGIMLLIYAIPSFVSSPSNVQAVVLAPTFWPTIIAWLIILLGAVLIATQYAQETVFSPGLSETSQQAEELDATQRASAMAWLRILALGVLMAALVAATPQLGMVWTSMIAFAAFGLIVQTPKPVTTLVVAVLLPLLLYAFFNHVAGVAVPQGEYITLP